jgi:hypothetical protein
LVEDDDFGVGGRTLSARLLSVGSLRVMRFFMQGSLAYEPRPPIFGIYSPKVIREYKRTAVVRAFSRVTSYQLRVVLAVDQYRIRRHLVAQFAAFSRGRLLPRLAIPVPDSAFARWGHMSGRHFDLLGRGRPWNRDGQGAAGEQERSEQGGRSASPHA